MVNEKRRKRKKRGRKKGKRRWRKELAPDGEENMFLRTIGEEGKGQAIGLLSKSSKALGILVTGF